ncbi:MAG: sulfurase [Acidimicrobiaceae bacterium]|jgi:MOSC domain-containing protein YiiM|nr:sulfurase [Acidimicrobiaceae bacterium]
MGELLEIWLKKTHGDPMISLIEAEVKAGEGIKDSAKEPHADRQVTVLSKESWEAATGSIGKSVDPKERRANFIVSGIELEETVGKILQIGELKIEVTGETVPCKLMNEVSEGLRNALKPDWRGGITGSVINDCSVKKGDPVSWL